MAQGSVILIINPPLIAVDPLAANPALAAFGAVGKVGPFLPHVAYSIGGAVIGAGDGFDDDEQQQGRQDYEGGAAQFPTHASNHAGCPQDRFLSCACFKARSAAKLHSKWSILVSNRETKSCISARSSRKWRRARWARAAGVCFQSLL